MTTTAAMQVGDWVRPKGNPDAVPTQVVAIDDLGHGPGYERVAISLFGAFTRYYTKNELRKVRS